MFTTKKEVKKMSKNIEIIAPEIDFEKHTINSPTYKKRVASYCRVSTDNAEQKTSYDAQKDEYSKRILANKDWEFVDVYADEGISGTSTKKRVEFNRMINDALAGKIDLILTKSISRFARNTVDCLSYIQKLRSKNVEIFFEKENIYSSDPKVDFLLTIMSSIAQEEARNISENVNWNVQKRFKEGKVIVNHKWFLGYTKDENKNLIIDHEQAEIVKLIYNLYLDGKSAGKIAKYLTDNKYKNGAGSTRWYSSNITQILKNEKYCGDLIQQKTITTDFLNHKRAKNTNLAPKFKITDNHEAIIDRETFDIVQKILNEKRANAIGDNKDLSKYNNKYPFSSMLYCLQCGRTLKRRYWNHGYKSARIMQQCGGYLEGKGSCDAKALYQTSLDNATVQMMNEILNNKNSVISTLMKLIKENISCDNVIMKNIEQVKNSINVEEAKVRKLISMKTQVDLDDEYFKTEYTESKHKILELKTKLFDLENDYANKYSYQKRVNDINEFLLRNNKLDQLDEKLFKSIFSKIIVVNRNELIYCIESDKAVSMGEFKEKLKEYTSYTPIHTGEYIDTPVEYSYPECNFVYPEKNIKYKVILI